MPPPEAMVRSIPLSDAVIKKNVPALQDDKIAHLLVSHASRDTVLVWNIVHLLEDNFGISCFVSDRDYIPGMPIVENFERGLQNCLSVVLMITPSFFESQWCKYETDRAVVKSLEPVHKGGYSVLPVLLADCELPMSLVPLRSINAKRLNKPMDIANKIAISFVGPYILVSRHQSELHPLTQEIYEKAITEGKEEDNSIRLMIVGCHDQGKTTLSRRLLRQPLNGIESTNGIDIHRAVCTDDTWEHRKEMDIHKENMKRLALVKTSRNESRMKEQDFLERSEILYTRKPNIGAATGDSAVENLASIPNIGAKAAQSQNKMYSKDTLKLFQQLRTELSGASQTTSQEISLWDFGGQFIFYATHQLFHSRNAVYLLVFDLHRELNSSVIDDDYPGDTNAFVKSMKDYIEFWVTSIDSFVGWNNATRPTIILVGTHKDELKDDRAAEDYFESVKKMFDGRKLAYHIYQECFAISGTTNITDDVIDRLRETIIKVGKENKLEVPARWIPLETALKEREKENIVTFDKVLEINNSLPHPIEKEDHIKSFLNVHHARGTFIYFDDGEMAKYVVVNPPFIVDAFKCIITSGRFCRNEHDLRPLWQKLCQEAILDPVLLQGVWDRDAENRFAKYKDVLVSILKRSRIIAEALRFDETSAELTPLGYFLVPSLLRKSTNGEIETFLNGRNCTTVSMCYVFENEAIVPTVFNRVTAAAAGSWPVVKVDDNYLLFEDGGVYRLDRSHAGLIVRARNVIELQVAHMCLGGAILPQRADYLRRFVEHVIEHEFRKLATDDTGCQDTKPFKIDVRCQHKMHNCKGSRATYDYESLTKESERDICCPDNMLHDSLKMENIKHEWFMLELENKYIPKRRLSPQECSILSTLGIGSVWQQLAIQLGIDDITIQHIEMDNRNTSMQIYQMLLQWDSRHLDEATLDKLVEKLRFMPPKTVNWDIVNNVIDNIYQFAV